MRFKARPSSISLYLLSLWQFGRRLKLSSAASKGGRYGSVVGLCVGAWGLRSNLIVVDAPIFDRDATSFLIYFLKIAEGSNPNVLRFEALGTPDQGRIRVNVVDSMIFVLCPLSC